MKDAFAKLPQDILESDLKQPSFKAKGGDALVPDPTYSGRNEFELWYTTAFGWCIPTLAISNAKRSGSSRTYATTLEGKAVRIGHGPHVLHQLRVYVRQSRATALAKYLQLRDGGEIKSNEIRDRISSRRAQGVLHRAEGKRSWYW